jgi:hypothetical protein
MRVAKVMERIARPERSEGLAQIISIFIYYFMKTLFAVALLAAVFTFTSCGNKPADATTTTNTAATTATTPATPALTAEETLIGKIADCSCESVNTALKLKKDVEAAPEKEAELQKKTAELLNNPACMAALEADMKKLDTELSALPDGDAKKKVFGDAVQAAMVKKCGTEMKALDMPMN